MNQTELILDDFFHMAFPAEDVKWLSERSHFSVQVNWICVDVENGQAGDILLIPADKLTNNLWKVALQRKIVAVVIHGNKLGSQSIPKGIPVLQINSKKDFRQFHQTIAELLINKNAALNEQKLHIHKNLIKMVADGVGLNGLAKAMQDLTRHSILIQDKRLNTIAHTPAPDLQSSWDNIILQLQKPETLPNSLKNRREAGEREMRLVQDIPGGITRVIVPITVGSVARGYLSVIGFRGTLDALDHIVAEEGALICAIDMSRTKAVRETEKKLQSDLLSALLQEDLTPRDAKLWMDSFGLDHNQAHVAMQFTWSSENPPSMRRLETIVNGEVARLGAKVIINPTGETIVCFCEVPKYEKGFHQALELAENVLRQAASEFPDVNLCCGVGSPALDINQWHISFKEAGSALDMAIRLKENKPLYYPNLSVYRLLLLVENNPKFREFRDDILGPLLQHENKDEFIRTLETYFEQQRNLSRTAGALFIHRNTLTYRMRQIKEIAQLDLNNYDTALSVQFALKIYRLTQEIG